MSRYLTVLTGTVLLIILGYYCIHIHHAQHIPQDIHARTSSALESRYLENVVVYIDGRDITLTGSVSEEKFSTAAANTARSIEGVRSVDNRIEIKEE